MMCLTPEGLLLASFELGVFLIDDVKTALATDDLTICCTLFERCSYFHDWCEYIVIALYILLSGKGERDSSYL